MSNNQNSNNQNQNQQQNNQQGGLLNRVNNTNNNQNQNNQNQQQSNQNNNNQNNSLRSRFGNNNNRFGNNNKQPAKPTWTITPMSDAGVRIAFQGIGDPLFRILGMPLDKSISEIEVFAEKLANDDELCQQLIDKLDEAWATYDISGAIIMHPVRKNIQEAFTMGKLPLAENDEQSNNDANNNNNGNNRFSARKPLPQSPYSCYRAVDAAFVLNILGRVRGNVLVDETPVALEAGFLNQAYICDDPRVVEMALATGAIEESW